MPVYEYACKACGQHLEVVQSFKDGPLTTCPACGGALRKVFGSIGVVLKGSGFYRTDSRTPPKETKKETAAKAGSGEKSGSTDKAASSSGEKPSSSSSGDSGPAKAEAKTA